MEKFLLLALFLVSTHLYAEEEKILCPLVFASSVIKKVEANGDYDKFKHCSVSCMLTLRCPATEVIEIGILKELVDMTGIGNPEVADLKANFKGVRLVTNSKVSSDQSCMKECHLLYPKNECK